jgi:DNA modification methylase
LSIQPYYCDEYCTLYCADCAVVLPTLERHDLLLTDPPYGIDENPRKIASRGRGALVKDYGQFIWDKEPIPEWLLLLALSKGDKAIVFGGNYYSLPPTSCWLVWNKLNGDCDFADCELAWTNLKKAVRKIDHLWNGMIRQNGEFRQHPTQKPLRVISWCIEQAGSVQTVLDPFAGSGTALVAAKLRNIKATGIECEERYCEIAAQRLSQGVLGFWSNGIDEIQLDRTWKSDPCLCLSREPLLV